MHMRSKSISFDIYITYAHIPKTPTGQSMKSIKYYFEKLPIDNMSKTRMIAIAALVIASVGVVVTVIN